jgi:pseudouridine-5'-phosphate glycosidase
MPRDVTDDHGEQPQRRPTATPTVARDRGPLDGQAAEPACGPRRLAVLSRQLTAAPGACASCCGGNKAQQPAAVLYRADGGAGGAPAVAAAPPPSVIDVSDEVRDALARNRPVVALESTIISHGMPFPRNLETARRVEAAVRAAGAVPATVAVLSGRCVVGCTDAQLERIARAGNAGNVRKVSRRDLPYVASRGEDGATTVAATSLLAAAAGIDVFATGGVGGVHRGGESTMDVSADLDELARTPVLVVCAGVKSVLDIPRTLEALETRGVAVATLRADEFPAFFSPRSGSPSPLRLESAREAAAMVAAQRALGLRSGALLAVPIPPDEATTGGGGGAAGREEGDGAAVERATREALAEAEAQGVSGAQITPFLLERIRSKTGGRSLDANVRLVVNNARVAAEVARELCAIRQGWGRSA